MCIIIQILIIVYLIFFFNDTATTEIYTLSLHDALPIYLHSFPTRRSSDLSQITPYTTCFGSHTSELQSRSDLVCRLLLQIRRASRRERLEIDRKSTRLDSSHDQISY